MHFTATSDNTAVSKNAAADGTVGDFAGGQETRHGVNGCILVIEAAYKGDESDFRLIQYELKPFTAVITPSAALQNQQHKNLKAVERCEDAYFFLWRVKAT